MARAVGLASSVLDDAEITDLGFHSGSGFVMCSGKENPDSDADLDVDGDDTLEYGKPHGGPPSTRITPEFSKWASDAEMPSTSNGESSKQEAMQKTCKNSDIEKTHTRCL
eukprot:bmy_16025T0